MSDVNNHSKYNPALEEDISCEEHFVEMGFEPYSPLKDMEFSDRLEHVLALDQEDRIPGL